MLSLVVNKIKFFKGNSFIFARLDGMTIVDAILALFL